MSAVNMAFLAGGLMAYGWSLLFERATWWSLVLLVPGLVLYMHSVTRDKAVAK